MKTELNIFTDIIAVIREGLYVLGYADWDVRQGVQPFVSSIKKPTLVITMLSSPHYGWQHSSDEIGDKIIHKEKLYQEFNFSLQAIQKTGGVNQSLNVINAIALFLNSDQGVNALQIRGYGIDRIREIRTGFVSNDSDVYERVPSFDFTVNTLQTLTSDVPEIAKIDEDLRRL